MTFFWSDAYESSFEKLKDRLTLTLVLTLPEGTDGFVIHCDASCVELVYVLMLYVKVVENAYRFLRCMRKNIRLII